VERGEIRQGDSTAFFAIAECYRGQLTWQSLINHQNRLPSLEV
jgi:hypothetical protein